eukprot:135292_1
MTQKAPLAPESKEKQSMKDDRDCGLQKIYTQTWSQTLHDIVFNFLRKNDYLPDTNDSNQLKTAPKSVLDIIAKYYANDQTNYKTFNDYITAIILCKYLSLIKKMKTKHLKDTKFAKIKKEYNLKKSNALTAKKVFKVLKDYKMNKFKIDFSIIDEFYVLFIDQNYGENILSMSYPNTFKYILLSDELQILKGMKQYDYDKSLLNQINSKGYFDTGTQNPAIRYHTMIDCEKDYVYALDYPGNYSYFIFRFKFFSIVIHDVIKSQSNIERKMEGNIAANQYRSLMEQWIDSGL